MTITVCTALPKVVKASAFAKLLMTATVLNLPWLNSTILKRCDYFCLYRIAQGSQGKNLCKTTYESDITVLALATLAILKDITITVCTALPKVVKANAFAKLLMAATGLYLPWLPWQT